MELLVVLAILSVLLAISIPTVSGILQSARKAQCTGNLRNLTAAMLLYSGDNNGELMPVLVNQRPQGEQRQGLTWANRLWSGGYLVPNLAGRDDGRGTILECRNRQGAQRNVIPKHNQFHYGYNSWPGFDATQNSHKDHSNPNVRWLSEIEYPSQTMAFAEVNLGYAIYPHLPRHRIFPHQDGVMVSYFDGRVEWLKGPLPFIPMTRPPGEGAPFY